MNKSIYRVRVVFIGKAIERSLPYEIDKEEVAERVANTLNSLLTGDGYHHYVSPSEASPVTPNQGKLRKKA